ncbi:hypothetical protein AMJ85_06175 [candidate division BRC1 bacterium SM23_51]|nr:MAG: hypothetical protein AMJ85_06175 [candidate division BRC1 bacterium SM23_51]
MINSDERAEIGSPQAWLVQAQSDLNLARGARRIEGVLPEQVAFHAQQCAEKAVKAVLVARDVRFPPTHSIQMLADLCEKAGLAVPAFVSESVELTPYAVGGRYLELPEPLGETDLDRAIELAASVLAWAEQQIASQAGS